MNHTSEQHSDIHVGKISGAKRVTIGTSFEGVSPEQGFAWARSLLANKITVDEIIDSDDVVQGLRIRAPQGDTPTLNELQRELSAIRTALDEVQAAPGSAAQRRLDDARADLATVSEELTEPAPDEGRVLDKLESATNVLVKAGEATDAAESIAERLGKLAPLLAILRAFVRAYFGV